MSIKDSGVFKLERDPSRASKTLAIAGIFLLLVSGMGFTPPEPPPTPEPTLIMPLGDSITEGGCFIFTYRYYLWRMLVDDNANIDFVGSHKNYYSGISNRPPHEGLDFDADHEGHWGWSLRAILDGHWSRQGNLSSWLSEYTPDIVLLHLDANEIGQSENNSSVMERLEKVIEELRADNPEVTILFARVIPLKDEDQAPLVRDLNSRIDALAAKISTDVSLITVVDQYDGFDADTDMFDGVHPNRRGAQKMAERWFEVLKPILDQREQELAPGA